MLLGPWLSRQGTQKMASMETARINQRDLIVLQEPLETGKVVPVIDRCYPLSEVPEAIRYIEDIHTQGKVIIVLEESS